MARPSTKFYQFGIAFLIYIITSTWQPTEAANILGLFTSQSPSGIMVHMSVAKTLAEAGHNVTVVLSTEPKITHDNIKQIIIPPTPQQQKMRQAMMSNNAETRGVIAAIKNGFAAMNFMIDVQFQVLKDKRFIELYKNPDNKFDAVILGYFFNDYQLGVAAKFKCPIILDWTAPPMEILHAYIGNPRELSYVPNMNIGVSVGESMTFGQRVVNLFTGLGLKVIKVLVDYRMGKYYKQLYPKENFPTYKEMQQNVSLLFVNHHFSEGPVRPNVPALVEIGGIQIKEKPDPLPEDIAKFLSYSDEHGAILFSLGSNLQGDDLKPETVTAMFNTLSNLKQNVIWKWENLSKTPGRSKNILYKKWLPQADILAHPNVKLFITHAGKGGLIEAEYYGVPMVALPFFSDQPGNARKIVASGYGLSLNPQKLTEKDFKNAINEVLNDPKYAKKVQDFSQLYRDRPLSAKDSVIYWTDYVIRHHGAAHLQSPLVYMNTIQSLNLDVVAFLCLTLYLSWKVVTFVFKFLIHKISKRGKSKSYKKIKNQ